MINFLFSFFGILLGLFLGFVFAMWATLGFSFGVVFMTHKVRKIFT